MTAPPHIHWWTGEPYVAGIATAIFIALPICLIAWAAGRSVK